MRRPLFIAALLLPILASAQEKTLLWGDTHLHTTYSSDAFANNNLLADPDTAYRYAQGLPVVHPYHHARLQIETPLDFLVVSDHAEYMGVIRHLYYNGSDGVELGFVDGLKADFVGWLLRRRVDAGRGRELFMSVLPKSTDDPREAAATMRVGSSMIPPMLSVEADTWRQIAETADRYNDPGRFTALIGWEWSSIPGGANLHRVVMTDGDARSARKYQPFGLDDSQYPEDLWQWLAATAEETGDDFIAIPHNANISKGYMFDETTLRGEPLSEELASVRNYWEPVAEITQIKGDSETHPVLSPDDPFADFENYPFYIQQGASSYTPAAGDFLRPALLRGLALEASLGVNPYQLGFIGSTDSHTSLSSAEEGNFHGKLATDSIPENKTNRWAEEEGPSGWAMSASGLAAVWAESNTRESILEAMRRREVYATTGPRIGVRLFAGWNLPVVGTDSAEDWQAAAAAGVPMGGELAATDGAAGPQILVQASRDPVGANLDRIQVIKGWIDAAGDTHERIYDVVWSGAREPDATGDLPAVGNTVNLGTGEWENSIGAPRLAALWQDPDFDPTQAAFYYVRVLQIPTPRHSLLDALALKQPEAEGFPSTLQERAYTSPVWYRPGG
ncbi:MAG TPA: hypothetical protein DD808_15510 [Halieaceae bacterium]|jgi:hypothetical protein|uniref:DUF3604 domain-containing protein n=1 Tax=Haliea TaxID=475794 RepID=UPI000C591703|nr:DUF3604 domain-containing protein [Haliea sp.]MAD62086.1 hypothetical protein [Haliea sp.]MAY93911.1 hypothetical protein [Haliea sp.]MBK41670.1 hypothetical protein [Haliea sp.]HBQ41952.1 hypothetical protein [Halieaceae bacterium]|tara:strand:- start:231 stop:2087 length:1857 start_codon:yes stop_codon:yes gene_type:complete